MIDNKEIANLRRSYSLKELSKKNIEKNPIEQFHLWLNESLNSAIIDPNAMTLATCSKEGIPSLRTVLLKGMTSEGFIFYSNYESRKGKELAQNPNAALNFYWKELERQITIIGTIKKLSKEESYEYFKTRPLESKIAAIVSPQSTEIENREVLVKKYEEARLKFSNIEDIPLPDYWGGYILYPNYFEFWQGREKRLHDRIAYKLVDGAWKISRLSP